MLRESRGPLVGFCCAILLAACGPVPKAQISRVTAEKNATNRAYIRIPIQQVTPDFIKKTGWDRDHKRDEIYAFGYIERDSLADMTFTTEKDIVELDDKLLSHFEFDAKTLELKSWPQPSTTNADQSKFADYHDYTGLTRELTDINAAFPQLTKLDSVGKTEEGRDIWSMEITGEKGDDPALPKLLYIANMHGDEVVGRELMLYLSRYLAENYSQDERIRRLLDNARIFIIPSMNPDGFEKEQRYNAGYVDLNRDFPDFTSDNRDEPQGRAIETQAIMALHAKHHFILSANFHGGEVCFNMPWDTKDNYSADQRFGDDRLMLRMAREYADANRTMRANSGGSFERGVTYGYEWYEVNGGMQDWSIHYRDSTHATVELSYAKWPPANQLPRFWDENREAMIAYLENGIFGFHLKIVDDKAEPVTNATIRISSLARDLTFKSHLIHRTALPQAQTVRITAPGFESIEKTLEPEIFAGNYQMVVLKR